ncbi:excisionase family DNA-binding protein [Ilumatobacter sp.]|uniref:excisionase family DNA-binding protein n=1 Tax=Ilumatobacter sp. TaxID=1967498 RepID=UPI0037504ACF
MPTVPDPKDRPTLSVHEYAALMEVGLSTAYASIEAGQVPVIRIGRRIRIPTAAVRRMLQLDTASESSLSGAA